MILSLASKKGDSPEKFTLSKPELLPGLPPFFLQNVSLIFSHQTAHQKDRNGFHRH